MDDEQDVMQIIKLIGRLQGQEAGIVISETIVHLFQWLAIQLWRMNGCMWAMRAPVSCVVHGS